MKPPPRWKMWLISLVAVHPLVLGFQACVVPLTTMTSVVMSAVTRLLRPRL
ncbi:hypothetical protein [Amycolatopsis sp. MEPSY49]|uniref:hypothetical protein n=1 Tax=Amycolatopsis sp. MEPSY49 TaxID=3151600 RepID=UPI003EF6EC9A